MLGGGRSFASGVNDAGQVIGQSTTADGRWHAVLWETTGVAAGLLAANIEAETEPYARAWA